MDWHALFRLIEATALSTWVRESPSMLAFPAILAVHAIGMAFLVGTCAAMDLRILGLVPRIPISSTTALLPVMRFGFWLNATSGVLLLVGFPSKHLTNEVFYLKLSLIAGGVITTWWMLKGTDRRVPALPRTQPVDRHSRRVRPAHALDS
jgi:hypothetical protein